MGVGRRILARMAFNVAIDGVVGIVPLFGDVFDAPCGALAFLTYLSLLWLVG